MTVKNESMKPIEVGSGQLGFYVFPKDWCVKEGLTKEKCISELHKIHKKNPKIPIKVISGTSNVKIVQAIIDEVV